MNNLIFFLGLIPFSLFSQNSDTVFILFDENYDEMEKSYFISPSFSVSEDEPEESITFYIEQREENTYSDKKLKFGYHIQSREAHKKFGGKLPLVLKKPRTFLESINLLDVNYFRTSPYTKIAKTFEKEESREQDVMIFLLDVDEMKNDSIVLRQVDFSRPVKQ